MQVQLNPLKVFTALMPKHPVMRLGTVIVGLAAGSAVILMLFKGDWQWAVAATIAMILIAPAAKVLDEIRQGGSANPLTPTQKALSMCAVAMIYFATIALFTIGGGLVANWFRMTFTAVHPSDPSDEVGVQMEIADRESKQGHYREAEGILKKLADKHPQNQNVLFDLGSTARDARDWAVAEWAFSALLKIDPHNREARRNLGVVLYQHGQKRYEESVHVLKDLVREYPDYSIGNYTLGKAALRAWKYLGSYKMDDSHGYYKLAKEQSELCAQSTSDYANQAHYNLACLYSLRTRGVADDYKEEIREAVTELRKAFEATIADPLILSRDLRDMLNMIQCDGKGKPMDDDLSGIPTTELMKLDAEFRGKLAMGPM